MKRTLFKKANLIALASLIAIPSFSALAEESDGPRSDRPRGERFLECFKREYNPTEEQITKVKELRAQKEDRRAYYQKMREMRQKMQEAMRGSATQAELKQMNAELVKLKTEKMNERFENVLEIREILTPEQRAKLGACRLGGGKKYHRGGHRGGKKFHRRAAPSETSN